MTTSHDGRGRRGASLVSGCHHHHHNPSSVVDNYDEHVEEDIAKAMAEFVETDLADNTSATTNAIGMAMTSAINPMAAWVHNESDQHKKHDNNEESLLAVLTSNALQSSSSLSSSPPPPSSSSSISQQQQQQDYHDELTISNQMNYSMEALPLNTPLSNALPMIQTNQSNIENELGLPFSSNNSVQGREDSREPLSQSISLDWNTVTAEQLKNDLSWDALIRLEAEVQKAMRLYDNQNEQSTDNNNRQPVKVATTTTTSLPIAVNRNTLRGRSIASNPSNNTIKRSNQPHRQILNSDALSATSARSTSPSVVSAATSSARSEVPRVRLLPAPLPVSKSINHTSNSSQLHRSLRSASATASTVSSSGSTVPNAKFFPAAFTSAATSTAIDRAKPSTGRPIASTTHRRIVSASTIPQPMPILLPSPSLPILQPAIPSVSTDIKRTANNKRSNGTTDHEREQLSLQPPRARRRLLKSTTDLSNIASKDTNARKIESSNLVKSTPIAPSTSTIAAVTSGATATTAIPTATAALFTASHSAKSSRLVTPPPPSTPLGPSIVPPPTGDPHPPRALPATQPITKVVDGVEWIEFSYSVKGANQCYRMRADIDAVDLATIPIRFKHDNCLYPRADVPLEEYRGNRWRYENECNNLGWRLAWLNREVMSGKRGLLQRAVDSYRNRYRTMRSRRVARLEKMATSTATTIITDNGKMGDESDGLTGKSRKKTTDTVDLSSINTAGTPSTLLDNEMIQNQLQHEISDDKLIKNESATNNNSISISLSLSASSILSNSTDFGQLSAHLLVPATLNETASPLESTVNHATSSLSTNALINTAINVASIADSTEWSAARSRFARVPKYLVFEAVIKGASTRVRIRVDPTQKEAALNNITEDFRRTNALYPRALCPREQYTGMRYELETRCNQLACELAALNPVRLNGRKALLQKAVDAYRKRFAFDWRPRRGKTALLIRVAAETAAMAAQQHSPTSSSSISAKLALNDTNGPTSNEEHDKTNDGRNGDGQNHTLSLLGVTPASTPPDVMSLALSTGESVNTSATATTLTDTAIVAKDASSKVAGAISHASLSDSLDYLRLPTDNMHFQSLDLSELEMLTQELSGVPTSNTNSVAINSATPVCLSNHEAQLQALLMDDDHELHDHHNEALLVKQLEEAFQRSSHGHDSSGNNSHISTTVTTPAASNHDMVDHGLSAVDLMHALQHH